MMKDNASLWAGVRRFEDILRKDPGAYSFAPLSDIFRELGLLEDALKVARKGCELHPDFAAGQMALARASFESALKDEAKKALEAVVRITPENIEAQRLLADIYSADGDEAAALRCLEIASSLDILQPLQAEAEEEEILDADILELTDDLIEVESIEESTISPFSADPERPSLGDTVRAEPYLMETPPPLYDEEQPVAGPSASVASATIAELYVNQGFPEKGVEIYRELLQSDPNNQLVIRRIDELLHPAPEKTAVEEQVNASVTATSKESAGSQSIMDTLNDWLVNIKGVRECRTKIL
jgi:tetratricopeptide (TPR) repeat protein